MSTPTIERHFAAVRLIHGTNITVLNAERLTAAIRVLTDMYANWDGSNTAMDTLLAAYPQMEQTEASRYLRAAQQCIDHDLNP